MRCDWIDHYIGEEGPISSSLTTVEISLLVQLATGKEVLEIGTAYGFATARMAAKAYSVTTIDPHAGYGSLPASLPEAQRLLRNLGLTGKVTLIIGLSQEVLPRLCGQGMGFDLVFVDGDHRLQTVREDLYYGWLLTRSGGVLAVHDYNEDTCPDVAVAVEWFKAKYVSLLHSSLVDTLWLVKRP